MVKNLKDTIKDVSSELIGVLNPRNKDVILRRFGLKKGEKETLESIGQSYGITRERVRQIEEASLKQIREQLASGFATKIKPFVSLAENILEQAGGVLLEDDLFNRFFMIEEGNKAIVSAKKSSLSSDNTAHASLAFLLTLDGKLERFAENDDFYAFWSLNDQNADAFVKSVSSLVSTLNKKESSVTEASLGEIAKEAGILPKYTAPALLSSYISVSKKLGRNIFGDIGLTKWPEIKPRGVRDKSYLVLKKEGKPKHFREITELINALNFSDRKANIQTVHNELIKDNRFILVGRGMYGLSEWGYKAGTVKDVLVDLMKSNQRPMTREEIISQVLEHRMVKENTIILNLQDSKTFSRNEEGRYTLREA